MRLDALRVLLWLLVASGAAVAMFLHGRPEHAITFGAIAAVAADNGWCWWADRQRRQRTRDTDERVVSAADHVREQARRSAEQSRRAAGLVEEQNVRLVAQDMRLDAAELALAAMTEGLARAAEAAGMASFASRGEESACPGGLRAVKNGRPA